MVKARAQSDDAFAADALHSAQTFMRLLDAAPLGMLVTTLEGMVVYANPAFSDLLGHRPEQGHVFDFADLVPAEDSITTRLHFDRLLRGEVAEKAAAQLEEIQAFLKVCYALCLI